MDFYRKSRPRGHLKICLHWVATGMSSDVSFYGYTEHAHCAVEVT